MKNYTLKINGNDYKVDINEVEGQEIKLEVNGKPYTVTVDQELNAHKTRTTVINDRMPPRVSAANGDVQRASAPRPGAAAGGTKVTTPLPGTILDVFVNVGDQVKSGQTVVLLEAMKMENNIEADTEGTVTSINVRKGDSVLEGDTLIVIS
jgi:biotin carboxyl carrier protein